jgi:hypothetical protein
VFSPGVLVDWIEPGAFRLGCPDFADVFIGRCIHRV